MEYRFHTGITVTEISPWFQGAFVGRLQGAHRIQDDASGVVHKGYLYLTPHLRSKTFTFKARIEEEIGCVVLSRHNFGGLLAVHVLSLTYYKNLIFTTLL